MNRINIYLLPFFHPLGKGLMKIIDDLGAAAIFLSTAFSGDFVDIIHW
jgi:hypothetical protein